MSSFTKPLDLRTLPSGKKWKVIHGFEYHIGSKDSKKIIEIPDGLITDLASVPRLFWSIFPPFGKYSQAAVLHDFLYREQFYTRKESDKIFLEAMKVLGVSSIKRKTMYRAVRWFGWKAWNKHSKNKEVSGK